MFSAELKALISRKVQPFCVLFAKAAGRSSRAYWLDNRRLGASSPRTVSYEAWLCNKSLTAVNRTGSLLAIYRVRVATSLASIAVWRQTCMPACVNVTWMAVHEVVTLRTISSKVYWRMRTRFRPWICSRPFTVRLRPTRGSLIVRSMYAHGHAQYAYGPLAVRSPPAQCTLTVRSRPLTVRLRPTRGSLTTRSIYAHGPLTATHSTLRVHWRYAHDPFTLRSRSAQCTLIDYPCYADDQVKCFFWCI
jgi:hypothetical protein